MWTHHSLVTKDQGSYSPREKSAMATKLATKNVSVRRNRDYSIKFDWTENLNKDLYQLYKDARSAKQLGYMQRLKQLWDAKFPMHCHLKKKQLRQQATFVERQLNRSSRDTSMQATQCSKTDPKSAILDKRSARHAVQRPRSLLATSSAT